MKVVAIVQARLNSTRLPRKVLLEAAGHSLLWHMLERVKRSKHIDQIVVTSPVSDVIEISRAVPLEIPIDPWMGDENDLVGRHLSAAKWANADIVVRVPSDNVLVQPEMIDAAIERYLALPSVCVSTQWWHLHDRVYADGLGAEVFSYNRLQWLYQATQGQPQYREHPHLLFQDQHLIDAYEQYQRYGNASETLRLDVNTQADYDFIADIYDALWPMNHNFTITDILAYLATKKVPA